MNSLAIYENIEYVKVYNKISVELNGFKTDTRKVNVGDCYIAIKGEKNDGNLFYKEAFLKGASVVILDNYEEDVEDLKYLEDNNKSIIVVKDSIETLGKLAKYKRESFKNPVVAITGSAGKTSTKDIVYSVLKEKYKAQKTIGNFNNHIGLPLTVLSLDNSTELLVLEMGMNHLGEISYLTSIAKPDVAIITNVGTAHIGNLGSRENILKAKLEILEGLKPGGTLIINNDNDLLHEWYLKNQGNYHILTIGINNKSDFQAENINADESGSTFVCQDNVYKVPVGGEHFVYNALVAIAVASVFDVDYEMIQDGIENFELSSNRMNIIYNENLKVTIIDDSYNANYDSMSYAVKYLSNLDGRLIAVLGTMKELGDYSEKLHRCLGKLVSDEAIDILITVGDEAKFINEEAVSFGFDSNNSYHFASNAEAIQLLKNILAEDDKVLIKASNSLNFKEIVEAIK